MRYFILLAAPLLLLAALPLTAQRAVSPYQDEADVIVADWYQRYVNRPPDSGAPGWAAAVRAALARGEGTETVLAKILGSPEYYTLSGSTPAGLVQRLYLNVVGRAPTPHELRFWLGQLYHKDRPDVAYDSPPRTPPPPPPLREEVHEYEYRRPARYRHRPIHHDWER